MYTKGAPEALLPKCTSELREGESVAITDERRDEISKANSGMAERALRTLALAYRDCSESDATACEEKDFTLVGIVGMSDPPREEAKHAVQKCRDAGVRPVMITGDHPVTALAIARELGIAAKDEKAMSGMDLDQSNDDQLAEEVKKVAVYARVSPEHKLRIVKALRKQGEIVAMTGDGVNDAPSIKAADIGIAMGITGTDVTKEASDMILMDDNFASIVNAIEKGRGIFDNIQKFVHYLLATNAGEVILLLFASLMGWPLPLLAVQILWINLVTDSLPALALGMEQPEKDIMQRPPRPPHESVVTRKRGIIILANGLLIAAIGMIGFWVVYRGDEANLERARTMTFCVVAFSQLFFAFGCRSQHHTLPELSFFSNRYLMAAIVISTLSQIAIVMLPIGRTILGVTATLGREWWLVAVLSIIPVTVIEISKIITSRFSRSDAHK
jgi:Ca2+-transporting ATPase